MALQKVFREAYVEALRSNIDPAKYAGESFDYEESQVHYMANVHQPENFRLVASLEIGILFTVIIPFQS